MRRPTIIIAACICIILGIVTGYNYSFSPNDTWVVFGIVSAVSAFVLSAKLRVVPIFLCSFIIGVALITSHLNYLSAHGLASSVRHKVIVEGEIKGDPYWDKDRNYVFIITNVVVDGQSKAGDMRIKTFSSAAKEGYRVRVSGKIYPILAKPGYQINYAIVAIASMQQPFLVQAKTALYTGIDRSLREPATGFIKGILVGARSSLPPESQNTLNAVGLSHVVAVSGYNLTILVVLFQRLLRKRWLWGSLVLSLVLVWGFVLLTGGSASVLRAGIMATVFLLASYYGRPLSIFTCISLTAVGTLVLSPTAVIEDIGWQLSFLSLTGIVILAPIIQNALPKKAPLYSELVSITLAAQIATIPYLLYLFGTYSLVALVSNMVLMPFIPFLMLAGFGMAIVGMILPNTAYIIGSPLSQLVDIIFNFLNYLQSQKSFVVIDQPDVIVLLIWYVCLVIVGVIAYHRKPYSGLMSIQNPNELLK